jgi:hypothetical protein
MTPPGRYISPAPAPPAAPWTPVPTVTQHHGKPVPPGMDFFIPPPPELGPIVSAYSTATIGKPLASPRNRRILIAVAGVVWCGFWIVDPFLFPRDNAWDTAGFLIVLGLFLSIAGAITMQASDTVSYVGELGMARFTCIIRREKIKKREMFLFSNALDLYTQRVDRYAHMVYEGTTFSFMWTGANGRAVWVLKGIYNKNRQLSPTHDLYWAQSAEYAWSNLMLKVMTTELEEQGSVAFRVNKRDLVCVGPGFMEFEFGGKKQRITVPEVGKLALSGGTFQIHHKDARWFSGQGKFSFAYGGMANARLFLLCLEKLCGFRFG